jgi:hypothetical protein
MSNFVRQWPSGVALNSQIPSPQLEQFDVNLSKAPNFDDGSSHNPSSPIDINGVQGLRIGGLMRVRTGAELSVESGGLLDVENGGTQIVRTTGTLLFDGTTNWPTVGARTFDVWERPRLASVNTNMSGDYPLMTADSSLPAMRVPESIATGEFYLEVPSGPQGQILVSVHVVTKGHHGGQSGGTFHLPEYRLERIALGGVPGSVGLITGSTASLNVIDAHTTGPGNWETTYVETVIPATGGGITYNPHTGLYNLRVTRPWNLTDAAGMFIAAVGAKYTMTQLRP